ncbi:hypothetical protein HDU86_006197 [Geranomyces michiganensis]|nr:hypothetical protein HDU86_006197 [Geranomyces michiganensis]
MSLSAAPILIRQSAILARPVAAAARPRPSTSVSKSYSLTSTRAYTSTPLYKQQEQKPPAEGPKDDPWLYSPDRDPMKNMSEAEKDEIRRTIRTESQRAFSVGYGIIGGGMLAVGIAVFFSLNNKKK